MLRPVLFLSSALLSAALLPAPSARAADDGGLSYSESARCGVLNSLMGVLEEGDAEKSRVRRAISLTWFALADEDGSLDEAQKKAAFDAVHEEEGSAVVAVTAEGDARAEHLLARLKDCDALRNGHYLDFKGMAAFLATADAAAFAGDAALARQGKEPPPIPRKDLSFADGWTFQSRGNNCTATRALDRQLTLTLAFTNFSDGHIRLAGKGLPTPRDEDAFGEEGSKHRAGAAYAEDAEGNLMPVLAEGVTYANFPGSAIFVDGALAGPFFWAAHEDGVTTYRFAGLQAPAWARLKNGKDLRIKILGQEKYRLSLAALGPLMAEMQECIDQYPDG